MRVLVIGSGGLGSYLAARLMKANHDVVLVSRGIHLQVLRGKGLSVHHPNFDFQSPVRAVDLDSLRNEWRCSHFDLILMTAKAVDTAPLMQELGLWLQESETPVLSLQSGVENEQHISREVGRERTLGGLTILMKAHVVRPGRVEAAGSGRMEIGAWPNQRENPYPGPSLALIQALFNEAGIPCLVSEDIRQSLWRKLVLNNGVNPISALTFQSTRLLITDAYFKDVVYSMMLEAVRAGVQAGIELNQDDARSMFELLYDYEDMKTPMLLDRMSGRRLEIDEVCAPVIHLCEQAGQPATWTQLISGLLKANIQGVEALKGRPH